MTLLAMAAVSDTPILFPSCAIVWKMPPAKLCFEGGKTDIINKFATVKSTSPQTGERPAARKAHA